MRSQFGSGFTQLHRILSECRWFVDFVAEAWRHHMNMNCLGQLDYWNQGSHRYRPVLLNRRDGLDRCFHFRLSRCGCLHRCMYQGYSLGRLNCMYHCFALVELLGQHKRSLRLRLAASILGVVREVLSQKFSPAAEQYICHIFVIPLWLRNTASMPQLTFELRQVLSQDHYSGFWDCRLVTSISSLVYIIEPRPSIQIGL